MRYCGINSKSVRQKGTLVKYWYFNTDYASATSPVESSTKIGGQVPSLMGLLRNPPWNQLRISLGRHSTGQAWRKATAHDSQRTFHDVEKYQYSLELLKPCITINSVFWDVRAFFSDVLFSHLGWQQQRNNQRHFGRSVYYGVVQIVNRPFFVYVDIPNRLM